MMDGFERSAIVSALNTCHGNIKDTMVQPGIARKTLYDKMKKHGLDKAQFKDWTGDLINPCGGEGSLRLGCCSG